LPSTHVNPFSSLFDSLRPLCRSAASRRFLSQANQFRLAMFDHPIGIRSSTISVWARLPQSPQLNLAGQNSRLGRSKLVRTLCQPESRPLGHLTRQGYANSRLPTFGPLCTAVREHCPHRPEPPLSEKENDDWKSRAHFLFVQIAPTVADWMQSMQVTCGAVVTGWRASLLVHCRRISVAIRCR